jgi:hypothetical protein
LTVQPPKRQMSAVDRIFLAHAREDKAQVRKLYNDLKMRGFNPWLDEIDLIPGQVWRTEIPKAIRQAEVFLACLSARSVAKVGYVQNEFKLALAAFGERPPGSIWLIPARLDDCVVPDLEVPDIGVRLSDIQWVDLWEEGGFDRLVIAIERALCSEHPRTVPPGAAVMHVVSPPSLFENERFGGTSIETVEIKLDKKFFFRPLNERTLKTYTRWKFPELPVDERIQRLLLRDIDKNRYKSIGDLDHVVKTAANAVEKYRDEEPEIFKAGTDYLTKSLGFVDLDFRDKHPFSAQTREAFWQYDHLVREMPFEPPFTVTVEGKVEAEVGTWNEVRTTVTILSRERPGSRLEAFDRWGRALSERLLED